MVFGPFAFQFVQVLQQLLPSFRLVLHLLMELFQAFKFVWRKGIFFRGFQNGICWMAAMCNRKSPLIPQAPLHHRHSPTGTAYTTGTIVKNGLTTSIQAAVSY